MQSIAPARKKLHLLPVLALIFAPVGCDLFEGTLAPLPFAQITSVQLFDEPNFAVGRELSLNWRRFASRPVVKRHRAVVESPFGQGLGSG